MVGGDEGALVGTGLIGLLVGRGVGADVGSGVVVRPQLPKVLVSED